MTKLERIKKRILADRDLVKAINRVPFHDIESYIQDGLAWIKAIKERRMLCSIDTVSKSGMSRTMKFVSCERNIKRNDFYYRSYWSLFKSEGYTEAHQQYFRVYGCGMNMVFHTNYTMIHKLHRLGFCSEKECGKLAQMTPTVL